MEFNIPEKVSGPLDFSSLGSMGSSGNNVGVGAPQIQPQPQPQAQYTPSQYTQPQYQPQPQAQYQQQSAYNPYSQQPVQPQQPVMQQQQPVMQQPTSSGVIIKKQRPAATGVILKKGSRFSMQDNGVPLTNVRIGLGWDAAPGYDLDASVYMLGQNDKVPNDNWFVYYGQQASPDGSVYHHGDSKGESIGDDEIIDINLTKVNPAIQKLAFVVTINEAIELGQTFSGVENAYIRVVDNNTNKEICRFNLTDNYAKVTSVTIGELYRYNNEWKLKTIGNGLNTDLAGLCAFYGVNVAD